MPGTRTIGRFGLIAAMLVSCAIAQAMDLRDMPDWVRERIWPVEIDWQAMGSGQPAEVTGVHIFGTSPAVTTGTQTASPVNFGAPTVTTPGGEAVTVGAPGLATGGGVHVPGFEGDAAGATGVSPATAMDFGDVGGVTMAAPGMGEVGVAGGVHVEAMGAEWDEALTSIEGLDRETLAQAGQILAMIREEGMSPEEFAAWATEHEVTPEVLTAGLLMVGVHRHDNYPTPQPDALVLASGLEALAGEGLSQVSAVPPFGRLWLAILLGRRGDEAGALTVFDSMTDEQLVALPRETSIMTIAHLMRAVPRMSIFAIKRYGSATHEEAAWCTDLYAACTWADDPQLVRDELIPWAERALGMQGSERQWQPALGALLWGYGYVGEGQQRIDRGRYWLREAKARNVPPASLWITKLRLASSLTSMGEVAEAAQLLREVIQHVPGPRAEIAQTRLLRLAQTHGDVGEVAILAPKMSRVWPTSIEVSVSPGERRTASVTVTGNATFEVTGVATTLPIARAVVRHKQLEDRGWVYELRVQIGRSTVVETLDGSIIVETNNPEQPVIRIPMTVDVTSQMRLRPSTLFFGLVERGQTATARVQLTGAMPFNITGTAAGSAQHIDLRAAQLASNSWTVTAKLDGGRRLGVLEGHIQITTDVPSMPSLDVPYYAQVVEQL